MSPEVRNFGDHRRRCDILCARVRVSIRTGIEGSRLSPSPGRNRPWLRVCTKVHDTGSDGLLVETKIAFSEGGACKALAELEEFEVGPGDGYCSDPFEFAGGISQDDRTFHVEEHGFARLEIEAAVRSDQVSEMGRVFADCASAQQSAP